MTEIFEQESRDHHNLLLAQRILQHEYLSDDFYKRAGADNGSTPKAYLIHEDGLWRLADFSCDFVVAVSKVVIIPVGMFWFRMDDPLYFNFSRR